jgi:DNA-binding response OmpR family regulator
MRASNQVTTASVPVDVQKILIGCNEIYLVKAIKLLLGKSCEVTVCSRLDEFVRDACTGGFDLVILYANCLSPPPLCAGGLLENSVFATKTIKSSTKFPIIALTSMPEWRDALSAAGADICLNTPFDAPEFRDAAFRCLSGG